MRLWLKGAIWLCALTIIARLLWLGLNNQLGPDPGKDLTDSFGLWALRFLLMTLCMRPLFDLSGKAVFLQVRRLLGLFTWFFATMHFAAGLFYVIGISYPEIVKALAEKTYVVLGFAAWCLLVPLGVTSNRFAQRKLGRRWRQLHRLIYPAALIACLHFLWLVRSDYLEPAFYCLLCVILLCWRLRFLRKMASPRANV